LQRLLLFRVGSFQRLAIPLALVARLEEFPLSLIEHANGSPVIQYRNGILKLIALRNVLEPKATPNQDSTGLLQVVVIKDGTRSVGLIVDGIIDVAEESVTVKQEAGRTGFLGSAIVGNRVTDFLDIDAVIQASEKSQLRVSEGRSKRREETSRMLQPVGVG